jgi:MbtH protein
MLRPAGPASPIERFKLPRDILFIIPLNFFRAHMSSRDQRDQTLFEVLVNEEEHYSIRLAGRASPSSSKTASAPLAGQACLARIQHLRTDMRPRSLTVKMGPAAR